jgi:H+/Cl- antiporter ClcA
VVWALVVGPLAGLAAVAYTGLITRAHALRPSGWQALAAPIAVFLALGALAIVYPQLLGNGKGVVQLALVGKLSVALLAVLLVLKPLATAACLGSGAPGGLFTPTLAFGVLLGGLFGYLWSQLWPGAPLGAYAIVGGAAVLGAAMQGPLAAVVLLLELTHRADALMVPILVAVVGATIVARLLGAPSIYAARLPGVGRAAAGTPESSAAAADATDGVEVEVGGDGVEVGADGVGVETGGAGAGGLGVAEFTGSGGLPAALDPRGGPDDPRRSLSRT